MKTSMRPSSIDDRESRPSSPAPAPGAPCRDPDRGRASAPPGRTATSSPRRGWPNRCPGDATRSSGTAVRRLCSWRRSRAGVGPPGPLECGGILAGCRAPRRPASGGRSDPGRPDRRKARLGAHETELEDGDVVRRVLAGEEELFEILVRRYQARVVSHVARMVGNRDDALDLSQEIFLKVFQALERFNPAFKFSTWLFRIAGNAVDRPPAQAPAADGPARDSRPGGDRHLLAGAALDGPRPLRRAAQRRAGQGDQPRDRGPSGRFSGADRPAALRGPVLRGDRRGQEHAPRHRQEQTLSGQSRIEGKVVWRSDVTTVPSPPGSDRRRGAGRRRRAAFSPPTPPGTPPAARPAARRSRPPGALLEALDGLSGPPEAVSGLADRVMRLRAFSAPGAPDLRPLERPRPADGGAWPSRGRRSWRCPP